MIEVRSLCAGYRNTPVIRDLSLSFEPGRVLALIGPNGCGKSTLLRTIMGLQPKISGQVLFDGTELDALSPRQVARKAAFMPQSRNVPSITVSRMVLHGRFPYLSYPRTYQKRDREIARQMLERVGMAELSNRPMPELSGGQRQKVYLAMALAQDTKTIFMDEPTTFLDVRHQLEVMDIAKKMAGEGKAVVMVLHDLCLAMRGADQLAVLSEGRLIAHGPPETIYTGGIIRRVFGVSLNRIQTEHGFQYYYQP